MTCPRCGSEDNTFLFKEGRMDFDTAIKIHDWIYWECVDCQLIFIERDKLSSASLPSSDETGEEK